MVSLMMSSENAFESDGKNDAIEKQPYAKTRDFVCGDEKLSLSLNSNSVATREEEISGVPMHVEENARVFAGGLNVVVDFCASEEARVSSGVGSTNEFRVREVKDNMNDDEKSDTVDNNGFGEFITEPKLNSGPEEKGKVELVSRPVENNRTDAWDDEFTKKEHHKKGDVSDYDSMLSMFDQFAANGKSGAVGYGYEIGDMVWGKVKSHPWWPGHIFNEAFATASVRRTKREGHVLVAFFGDSSYGWFDPAELIPFEPNFAEKSRQTYSRTFLKSVEEAIDEVNRRRGLCLACMCRSPYNFRPTTVEGYFAVDVGDYEAGIYSSSQIKRARDSFQPGGMLNFVKQLALNPMNNEFGSISFIQNKATVLALRKAVFEEFDETYAQAFGAQPVRPVPPTTLSDPTRAPLSGRLVIAEALGKGRSTGKPNKSKDQVEKEKYLFKRRDETIESKTFKMSHVKEFPSGPPQNVDGSVLNVKNVDPGVVLASASHPSVSNVTESLERSVSQQVAIDEPQGQEQIPTGKDHLSVVTDAKLLGKGTKMLTDYGIKKAKVHKRPLGEMNSESSVVVEKKKKKRKKDLGRETSFDHSQTPGAAIRGPPWAKDGEKFVQTSSAPTESPHVNLQGSAEETRISLLPDIVGTELVIGNKNFQLELPELLNDLHLLALNPFHGAERSCPANMRQIILRYRSLVYQKSLSLLTPTENEPKEAHPGALPSLALSSDSSLAENSKDEPAAKPLNLQIRQEDPIKGGCKRGPSDRQEEIAAKKKKKISHLKVLASEKRASQKIPESERGDGREMSAKVTTHVPERKTAQRAPEVQRRDGKEMVGKPVDTARARVLLSEFAMKKEPQVKPSTSSEFAMKKEPKLKPSKPTTLVMKFAPDAALPSSAELRAKFARFGPLDISGTRIFWSSSTCRMVFWQKKDALSASAAVNEGTVFPNTTVRSYIREVVEAETPDTESVKVQRENLSNVGTSQSRDPPVLQHRLAANVQQPVQLKSCLKKPSNDDGGITTGGNGTVRGRVKFMLGGEGSSKTIADDGASSDGFNYNTEKIQMVVPPPPSSSSLPPVTVPQFPIAPNNFPGTEIASRIVQNFSSPVVLPMPGSSTNTDITHQMLSLLSKCKDVVNNLTVALGYVPYHPL